MQVAFKALTTKRLQLLPTNQRLIVERYVEDYISNLKDVMQSYPPVPPPPNRYVRTERLYNAWVIDRPSVGTGFSMRLQNNATDYRPNRVYSQYVQGEYQVWYHKRTGWKKLSDYIRRSEYIAGLRDLYRGFRVG
jgi:hypothetical protein